MKPRRRICDFNTSRQKNAKVKANGPTSRIIGAANTIKHSIIELDTHADTIVFGQSVIPLSKTGQECDVSPYTDEYDSIKNVPIVRMLVPSTFSGSTKSRSGYSIYNGELLYGLSCTVTPKCRS